MNGPEDRRSEPRAPAGARAVVVAPGLELGCLILDQSPSGLRLRLDRKLALPDQVQVVDVARGLVFDGDVVWRKGQEAGFRQRGQASLRGLVPSRLAAARAALLRAGGR
jgi:hypothetical protein